MRRALPALLLASLAACDSPGGGGGGTIIVDCSLTPDLPVCRRDVVNGDTGDVSDPRTDGDVGPNDTSNFETSSPDTLAPDTSSPDTLAPDTFVPECDDGDQRCVGQTIETCSDGRWSPTLTCPSDTACQGAACVPTAVCATGDTRCDGADLERCSNGQWTFQQTCASGCSAGACTTAAGTDACADVFDCVATAGCFDTLPTDSACTASCLAQGNTLGRQEMNAVITCYNSCGDDVACIVDQCSVARAACFFDKAGSGTCADIDACIGDCDTDACVTDCYEASTTAAQALYLETSQCIGVYCDQSDQACIQEVLTTGACADEFNACFP